MSALAKTFVILNLLLTVFFFGSTAVLYEQRTNWRDAFNDAKSETEAKLRDLREDIASLVKTSDNRFKEIQKLRTDLNDKSNRVKELESENESMKSDVTIARNMAAEHAKQAEQAQKLHQALVATNEELQTRLAAAKTDREQALAAQNQAIQARDVMRTDLASTQSDLHAARVEYADLSSNYETLELMFNALKERCPDAIDIPADPIDAMIVAVDAKDKIVVLSAGKEQKVKKGYRFTVYRDDQFVGKVEVFEVYPTLSGARVIFTKDDMDVEQGDAATTKLN